jgi:uncharacterized protein YbaP (TraB family)
MARRRFLVLFLALLLAIVGAGLSRPAPAAAGDAPRGLLWRIDAGGGTDACYLFGTVHVSDERVTTLAPAVRSAFAGAGTVALEIVFSKVDPKAVARLSFNPKGPYLSDLLDEALYRRAVAALAPYGMTEQAVNISKPWVVFATLSMPPGQDPAAVLDQQLERRALRAGKRVVSLETIEEQLGVLDDLPMAVQIDMLRQTLDSLDEIESARAATVEAYVSGDLDRIVAIYKSLVADMPQRQVRLFETRVIEDRNRRMAERMEPLLRGGDCFVAVGALHLPGKTGLIRLLRGRGYRVRPAS